MNHADRLQNRPVRVKFNEQQGYHGLHTICKIKANTAILEYTGKIYTAAEFAKLKRQGRDIS
jgi:cytoplasmic iron level regulating protein YaaA (DUF328/UPF0246 family)